MKRSKGFTLVELLAVIVILAIILVIAVPGISGLIQGSTKGAFTSDAKMVLKAVEYKLLEDSSFDPSTVNETNVNTLLNLDNSNYQTLTVKKVNDTYHVTIVGKNKWANLTASGTQTTTRVDDTVTTLSNGANKPALTTGMTPIKWNGSAWVNTTESDSSWYNYDTTNKQWANAKTADGSMWVWIPRYIYKISSGWHSDTAGTIDIQFSKGVDDNWNKSIIGVIDVGETSNSSNNKWTNHPAFTFGDTELTGFWVAKFEASAPSTSACYTSVGASNCNVNNLNPSFIPNVSAWRFINVDNMFTVTYNLQTNSAYGWGTSGVGIDTHLIKNTEWGAIAYLAQSTYGKNAEIWINPADNYTTGCAGDSTNSASTTGCLRTYDTANGVKASTTGTIYGIYDMSGCTWEYTAAYINNANGNFVNGLSLIGAASRYKNVYTAGTPDSAANNYALAINQKGDAIYETSNSASGGGSWYGDQSFMPNTDYPWFGHSSRYDSGPTGGAGAFTFSHITQNGYASSSVGFRSVLLVGTGF